MALAELAIRLGKADVAATALQAELAASPRSSAALQALAKYVLRSRRFCVLGIAPHQASR